MRFWMIRYSRYRGLGSLYFPSSLLAIALSKRELTDALAQPRRGDSCKLSPFPAPSPEPPENNTSPFVCRQDESHLPHQLLRYPLLHLQIYSASLVSSFTPPTLRRLAASLENYWLHPNQPQTLGHIDSFAVMSILEPQRQKRLQPGNEITCQVLVFRDELDEAKTGNTFRRMGIPSR
jgi:hypothetical protein